MTATWSVATLVSSSSSRTFAKTLQAAIDDFEAKSLDTEVQYRPVALAERLVYTAVVIGRRPSVTG